MCAESGASGSDGLNIAACHACLLLPETSCEHRNIYLDRLSIVGPLEGSFEGLVGPLGGAEQDATSDGGATGGEVLTDLLIGATMSEAAFVKALIRAYPSLPLPEIGGEVLDGIPLAIAWPDRRVVVMAPDMTPEMVQELEANGWVIVPPDVQQLSGTLGGT
ncbi:hypothetical protein NKG05_11110 [Oerskovia sp. M15]